MKILFLSHYFPPEVNAPASRTHEHCRRWVDAGHEVTVVTCVPNCPDGVAFTGYRNRLRPQNEVIDGIEVVRVWSYLAPNAGMVRRVINFVSYMLSAMLICVRLPRPDVIVATSPQFFCGWAGVWASRWMKRPLVLEIRDIWPESIQAVGAMNGGVVIRLLEWLERRMYRAAHHIVTVGSGYADNIWNKLDRPVPVNVVTNGVDTSVFKPQAKDERLLRQWGLEGKFVCSYVGTIGMAHGLDVVLESATQLLAQGREDIRFLLVGDGAQRARLESESRRRGVDRLVHFAGRLPREQMPGVLASSDACLVHLRGTELFNTVIPSKIFETMAMGRPIIMGVRGEAQRIVEQAPAGLTMQPDDAASLTSAVMQLADDPALRTLLSISARDHVCQHYNRDVLAARMLELLMDVAGVARDTRPVDVPVRTSTSTPEQVFVES